MFHATRNPAPATRNEVPATRNIAPGGDDQYKQALSIRFHKLYTKKTMAEELVTISVRVKRTQAEEIDSLAEEHGVDRSAETRELLNLALSEAKIRRALDKLREGGISVWKAAEVAGVTYREMLAAMREQNVPFPLSEEDLRREVEEISRRQ